MARRVTTISICYFLASVPEGGVLVYVLIRQSGDVRIIFTAFHNDIHQRLSTHVTLRYVNGLVNASAATVPDSSITGSR
jgi:hypothetical protein